MYDDYSKIDDYLNNRLGESEKRAFESKLEADKDLQRVVNDHEVYAVLADEIIDDTLSQKIKAKQALLNKGKKERSNFVYLFTAAVLVCLLGLLYFVNKPSLGEKIFAEFYSPPMGTTVRGQGVEGSLKTKPCFLGHIQLDEGQVFEAKISFESAVNDPDLLCREKAYYYLSLISVKENDFEKAMPFISKVQNGEISGYEQKANLLLKRIKGVSKK